MKKLVLYFFLIFGLILIFNGNANDVRNFAIYINLETNKTYKGTSHNSLRNAIKIAKRDCLNDLKDSLKNNLCQKIEENGFSYSKGKIVKNRYDISDLKKKYLPAKPQITKEKKIKNVKVVKKEEPKKKISFCKLKNNYRIIKKEKCMGSFKKISQENYIIGYLALSGDNLKKSQNQLNRLKKHFKSNDIDIAFINKAIKKNSNLRIYATLLNPDKKLVKPKKKQIKTTLKKSKESKRIITKKITIKEDNQPQKEITKWEKDVLAAKKNEKNNYCETDTERKIIDFKKDKLKIINPKKIFTPLNYCIKLSQVLMLGKYEKLDIPKIFLDKQTGCKSNECLRKKSGKKVYMIFVQKGQRHHARYPGSMIEGMSWFELLYQKKLRETTGSIKRYLDNDYKQVKKLLKQTDEKKIYSLIKMNKGRIKMREALGFSLYDKTEDVIEQQILLANFLNKDELKVTKNAISPNLVKRKELIDRYKSVLARYKEKLEDEKQKKVNEKNKS